MAPQEETSSCLQGLKAVQTNHLCGSLFAFAALTVHALSVFAKSNGAIRIACWCRDLQRGQE